MAAAAANTTTTTTMIDTPSIYKHKPQTQTSEKSGANAEGGNKPIRRSRRGHSGNNKTTTDGMHNVRHSSGYLRRQKGGCWPIDEANRPCEIDDDVTTTRYYPTTTEERAKFVNPKTSRTVTLFQYRVYDACAQIPPGHFTTYKHLADALGSGPRAVGNALRLNPFAPLPIPCHRVLTSNYFLGGFDGDKHTKIFFKRAKLQKEGLEFDDDGFVQLGLRESRLFADFKV